MFEKDVKKWLKRQHDFTDDIKYVVSVQEDKRHGGYCETCAYTYTVVEITYVTEDGDVNTYEEEIYFSTFVKEVAYGG